MSKTKQLRPTFKEWLIGQTGRADDVGAFARLALDSPPTLPSSLQSWKHHLRGSDPATVKTFERAWHAWRLHRGLA